MQIVNKTHRCSKCGCIAFPDAIRCPKCDTIYNDNKAGGSSKAIFSTMDYSSNSRPAYTDMRTIWAHNEPVHPLPDTIGINVTIIVPTTAAPSVNKDGL